MQPIDCEDFRVRSISRKFKASSMADPLALSGFTWEG